MHPALLIWSYPRVRDLRTHRVAWSCIDLMLDLLIVNPPRVMCLSLEKLRADQDIVIPPLRRLRR